MPCLLCRAFITQPLEERSALHKPGRENTGGQVGANEKESVFCRREIKDVARLRATVMCLTAHVTE